MAAVRTTRASRMNNTGINWSSLTWNPMSGCEETSTECSFCYAEELAENKRGGPAFPDGFELTFRPHRLRDPELQKDSQLIFCNSMSDPGLPAVLAPIEPASPLAVRCRAAKCELSAGTSYFDLILERIRRTPRHRYQMLTKRPREILAYLRERGLRLPSNVWMGCTIGHASSAWRLDVLRELAELGPALIFLSCEPLLGPLELNMRGVGWVISGGKSGVHGAWPVRMRADAASEVTLAAARIRGETNPWVGWWQKRHQGALPTSPRDVLAAADKSSGASWSGARRGAGRPSSPAWTGCASSATTARGPGPRSGTSSGAARRRTRRAASSTGASTTACRRTSTARCPRATCTNRARRRRARGRAAPPRGARVRRGAYEGAALAPLIGRRTDRSPAPGRAASPPTPLLGPCGAA